MSIEMGGWLEEGAASLYTGRADSAGRDREAALRLWLGACGSVSRRACAENGAEVGETQSMRWAPARVVWIPRKALAERLQAEHRVLVVVDDELRPRLPLVEGGGDARAIVWPGVGAHLRSLHRITLDPGARTIRMQHPMEAVYYLVSGSASAEDEQQAHSHPLRPGSMTLVDPGTPYRFVAGDSGAELVGGPCPADPMLYRHLDE